MCTCQPGSFTGRGSEGVNRRDDKPSDSLSSLPNQTMLVNSRPMLEAVHVSYLSAQRTVVSNTHFVFGFSSEKSFS